MQPDKRRRAAFVRRTAAVLAALVLPIGQTAGGCLREESSVLPAYEPRIFGLSTAAAEAPQSAKKKSNNSRTGNTVSTVPEFIQQLQEHTDRLEREFTIYVTNDLCDELVDKRDKQKILIQNICTNLGVLDVQYSYRTSAKNGSTIQLQDVVYYPGKKILAAKKEGDLTGLSDREAEALRVAESISSKFTGDQITVERQIHDELLSRITYVRDDDGRQEESTAVGALLNGRADCDGYSDAFYLTAGLAGFEVGYQGGYSKDSRIYRTDSGHMWNTIKVNGTWLMTDLTWDDTTENIPLYLFFNLGVQEAAESHLWDARADLYDVTESASNVYRDEYSSILYTETRDGLFSMMLAEAGRGSSQIRFYYPMMSELIDSDELSDMIYSLGATQYAYKVGGRYIELYRIEYFDQYISFDRWEDLYAFLVEKTGAGEPKIGFHDPLLSEPAESDRIKETLYSLGVKTFRYSVNGNYMQISEIEYYEHFTAFDSWDDLYGYLAEQINNRASEISFYYSQAPELIESELVPDILYSSGVKQFSWSAAGNYIEIKQIVYYDHPVFCGSEDQLRAALREMSEAGIKSFTVYCTDDDFFNGLLENNASLMFSILDSEGCSCSLKSSQQYRCFIVENVRWK